MERPLRQRKPRNTRSLPCLRDSGLRILPVGGSDLKALDMDPSVFQRFPAAREFWPDSMYFAPGARTFAIEASHGTHILRLMPHFVDTKHIVDNMYRASKVVPVPRVLAFGTSGNCSFIAWEHVAGATRIQALVSSHGPYVHGMTIPLVRKIVSRLARIELSHNYLQSSILVDNNWSIVAVFNWDYSSEIWERTEYQSVPFPSTSFLGPLLYNVVFLEHAVDRTLSDTRLPASPGLTSSRRCVEISGDASVPVPRHSVPPIEISPVMSHGLWRVALILDDRSSFVLNHIYAGSDDVKVLLESSIVAIFCEQPLDGGMSWLASQISPRVLHGQSFRDQGTRRWLMSLLVTLQLHVVVSVGGFPELDEDLAQMRRVPHQPIYPQARMFARPFVVQVRTSTADSSNDLREETNVRGSIFGDRRPIPAQWLVRSKRVQRFIADDSDLSTMRMRRTILDVSWECTEKALGLWKQRMEILEQRGLATREDTARWQPRVSEIQDEGVDAGTSDDTSSPSKGG